MQIVSFACALWRRKLTGACLAQDTRALFMKMKMVISTEASQYNARELCTNSWSFSKVDCDGPYEAIAAELVQPARRAELMPQDIAMVIWAFYTARSSCTALLLHALAPEMRAALSSMSNEELSKICVAFAMVCSCCV